MATRPTAGSGRPLRARALRPDGKSDAEVQFPTKVQQARSQDVTGQAALLDAWAAREAAIDRMAAAIAAHDMRAYRAAKLAAGKARYLAALAGEPCSESPVLSQPRRFQVRHSR